MIDCSLREVWSEIRDATISLLAGVTFADLAERAGGPSGGSSLIGVPARAVTN